jgi:hypothetical protein
MKTPTLLLALSLMMVTNPALASPWTSDINCSGSTDVVDVMLAVTQALGFPLSENLDADGNAIPDACEPCASVSLPPDPSLWYYFEANPGDLNSLTDDAVIAMLTSDPNHPLAGRIGRVRTLIWGMVLAYRLNAQGHIDPNSGGQWLHGEVTDPATGQSYDVIHWKDIDDSSFSFYFIGDEICEWYYEN